MINELTKRRSYNELMLWEKQTLQMLSEGVIIDRRVWEMLHQRGIANTPDHSDWLTAYGRELLEQSNAPDANRPQTRTGVT